MWVRVKSTQNARAAKVRYELHCYQLLRFAGHLSLRHKLGDRDWYKQDDKEKEGPQWPGQVWVCKRKAVLVSSFTTGRLCVATQRKHTELSSETAPIPTPVKVMDQKTRCPESGIGRCHLEITRVILWTKTELRKDECILYLHTHTHSYGPHHQNYESPDSQFL